MYSIETNGLEVKISVCSSANCEKTTGGNGLQLVSVVDGGYYEYYPGNDSWQSTDRQMVTLGISPARRACVSAIGYTLTFSR